MMALFILSDSNPKAKLGREWLYQFFNRHPRIKMLIGDPHESARVNEATEENVRAWFQMFLHEKETYKVQDINIHNMDEHGLSIGKINPRKVVGAAFDAFGKLRKRTKMRNSQDREWVSIIECISGSETSIQPLIIFEGINVNIDWTPDDPPPYKYTADPTAWITEDIAIWWLNEIFNPQTKPRGSAYRILLFDNHSTHLTEKFEGICRREKIITIPLPSHTSDVLQPLDLIMFSPIKGKYKDKLYKLCELSDGDNTKKKDFCHLYYEARQETFKPSNIRSAFKKAGLIPWDPDSVIVRPDIIKLINQQPQTQPDGQLAQPATAKGLEIDLYHVTASQDTNVDEKLEMTHWVATKAIEALSSKTVELAQLQLKYQTLEHKHKQLQEKKGRKKVPPKRGRHLVEADDIVRKQQEWNKENTTPPPPRKTLRLAMRA
ncbi:CENP-B protein, partial [Aureobasidium melanogenum]